MAKNNPPNIVKEWKEYYAALENNFQTTQFIGCCSRSMMYKIEGEAETYNEEVLSKQEQKKLEPFVWNSISGYFGLSKDKLFKQHPWAVLNRGDWRDANGNLFYQTELLKDNKLLTPHHLITCAVTKAIYRPWQRIIENEIGYNVNCAENLVVLTNSAMVACHLKIPLHDGGHGEGNLDDYISIKEYNYYAKLKVGDNKLFYMDESNDDDPNKPPIVPEYEEGMTEDLKIGHLNKHMLLKAYHSKVFKELARFLNIYFKTCEDHDRKKFIEGMNKESEKILKHLARFRWILHPTGRDYKPFNPKGCCGVDVITAYGNSNLGNINQEGKHMPGSNEHTKIVSQNNEKELGECAFGRDHKIVDENFIKDKEFLTKVGRRKAGLVIASKLDYK